MGKQAALALFLAIIALGCEHPAEYDDTAEARWGVDATDENEPERAPVGRAPVEQEDELVMMPMPGPRTSTPSGVASGLHREVAWPARIS